MTRKKKINKDGDDEQVEWKRERKTRDRVGYLIVRYERERERE